jgi:putative ABC transport system permease protein
MPTIVRWLGDFVRDVRLALRSLTRQASFTSLAVVTLALGVGANSAMFSIANPMLVQPLPYQDADRLLAVVPGTRENPSQATHVAYATFRDWQQATRSFAALAGYGTAGSILTSPTGASVVVTTAVTGNLFGVLGSRAARGRLLTADDDTGGAPAVVVISDGFWRTTLNQRADVVGTSLTLDGAPYSVVGVMPPSFTFPHAAPRTDIWMPVTRYQPFAPLLAIRAAPFLDVLGRLGPGYDHARAQAEMDTIVSTLARQYPATDRDTAATVVGYQQHVLGDSRPTLVMLVSAVGVLLLIACANVAGLQLTRTSSRIRELAVRSAMGASRSRLMVQVLVESLVLALVGGAVGLLVAAGSLTLLRGVLGTDLPPVRDIGIDRTVLVFTFAIACVTGVVFGAVPAFVSTGADLQAHVKAGGRGATTDRRRSRAQGLLVVSEVALALVLLAGAGLLVRSLERLHQARTGFDATNVWTATVSLPRAQYATPAAWRVFGADLESRLTQLPGVEQVSHGVGVPFTAPPVAVPFSVEGLPVSPSGTAPMTQLVEVSPAYFGVLRIPLLRGRPFQDSDREQAPPVGIVNQTFARRFLLNREPVGQHLAVGSTAALPLEIVGVVADTAQSSLVDAPPPVLYLSFAQRPFWVMTFAVRTHGAAVAMGNAFQAQVAALAPDAPVMSAYPLDSLLDRAAAPSSHRTLVLSLLGALALLLAGVGIYGMVAHTVVRRTREVGVRIALGAEPLSVLRLMIMQTARLAATGIVLGILLSSLASPFLSTLLFQVTTRDPLTLVSAPAILALTALVACYVPARRATRVDPIVALRSE